MRRRVQAGVRRSLSCLLSALTEIPDFATSILSAADFPPCPFLGVPLTFAWPFNFRAAFAASCPAMTAFMAIPILGEWPSAIDWIAIALISIGVYIVSGGPLAWARA